MALQPQYAPSSRAIENRLRRLSQELANRISLGNQATEDEFFAEINRTLWDFYSFLRIPEADRIQIKHKDILSPKVLQQVLTAAIHDIQDSYDRIGETQDEILRRNNRYASTSRDIETRIQHANSITASVSKVLEDNTFEVSDSFSDETLLEGPAEGAKSLFVNGPAGLLTLPQTTTDKATIATIKILKSSNGIISTDHPIGTLADNNLDTWFEYSRTGETDSDPLTLELLVTLQTIQVINQIQIYPLALDDRAFPRVIDISTSLDGRAYDSIRSNIPTFLSKEEEDALFILGPVGFRNQDYADFTFTPRTCQYIRIKIQQGKRVVLNGLQTLRIALKDIKINQIQYEDSGASMTRVFPLTFSPRKFKLIERAVETNPLTSLIYQVSFDEGAQWFDIEAGTDIEVNTGSIGSLDVAGNPQSIKLKIIAERNRTKFNGLARPLASTVKNTILRVGINGIPAQVGLENVPLENSLIVSRPVASVGTDFGYPLLRANGEPDLTLDIPIKVRPFSETVKLNGHAWDRVTSFSDGGPQDRWYTIDYANSKIKFSDARLGMLPEGVITLQLDPEPVILPDTTPLVIDLSNAHDFNAEHTKVYWYDRIRKTSEEPLGRGSNKFQLINFPVVESVDVNEDVPTRTKTFYLHNIPDENSPVIFSDKVTFALQVDTPAATGEYSIAPLVSGILSPVLVTVYSTTDSVSPGTVSFEAKAKIQVPKLTYDREQWLADVRYPSLVGISGMVDVYYAKFSDPSVFRTKQTFIDGVSELTEAGDYSIDLENGLVYSFSSTQDQGTNFSVYSYQRRRALTWDFVQDDPQKLVINDESFLVTKNDQFPATLTNDDGSPSYVVYKDTRYIRVPTSISGVKDSPTEKGKLIFTDPDTLVTITYNSDDLIRGYVLPSKRTRIRLPHQSIVKNSVRFNFLSNDTDAYDDRIVTRETDGSITIAPKPIRSVYGKPLEGALSTSKTQRDIDKLSLTRERPFIDGRQELEKGGDYSVDYADGILYTVTSIPKHTIIQYEYADIRVSYVATQVLKFGEQYTLNLDNLTLDITSLGGAVDLDDGTSLLVRYDTIDQLREDPVKIYRFYSPILFGYQLKLKP